MGNGAGPRPDSTPDPDPVPTTPELLAEPQAAGGHAVSRPALTRGQRAGLVAGMFAAAAAVVLGALVLSRDPGPAFPSGPTAAQITVERTAPAGFPVSESDLRLALSQPDDLGPLADPQRRASCLTGLGYSPTMAVLGGRPLEVFGRSAVLLLFPTGTPDRIRAVVVEPTCTAAHTGLLAETVLRS